MEDQGASSPHGDEETASSSPSFPFFNHSATTLPNNLPPNIDDKPMARQKRKRTSPEDQAVLEAYYARDAKPDKAARLDLVRKVALGEKEVQIWFQNRRQSSRRKSRPLLPHEIAQYQLSKPGATPDLSSSGLDPNTSQMQHQIRHQGLADSTLDPIGSHDADQIEAFTEQARTVERSNSPQDGHPSAPTNGNETVSTDRPRSKCSIVPTEYIASSGVPSADIVSSAYLAGGRGTPDLYVGHSRGGRFLTHGHPNKAKSPRRGRKSSSVVRLSMNSEGGAQVVAKDSSSPSPPRPTASSEPKRSTNDSAASSSVPDTTTSQMSNVTTTPALHRAPSGRSRDSRAWEFWCDKDCRTELEEKAEKDQSGSAADAIQLLRSTSGRSVLGPLPAKRNSAQPYALKRMRREARMPLRRSSTSNGRLQGKKLAESASKGTPKLIGSNSAFSVHIPGNSSDKENWSPGSDLESESAVGQGEAAEPTAPGKPDWYSRNHFRPKTRHSNAHRQSIDPENDPEIAAFMRAGRDSDKVSDHEELDCVQGLLSLSQGNWR